MVRSNRVQLCLSHSMALRVIFVLALFLFSTANVSSDSKIEQEDAHHFSQALNVFTRGANRNLMQDVVMRLSRYINKGHAFAVAPAPAPVSGHLDCGGLCKHRCSQHSRQNVCLRACGTCCARCKCVPPGTSGNRELCGKCYTGMTTHGNRTKCP